MHFHLSRTTCGSPQKRPFTGHTFFTCISSAVSSQATTRNAALTVLHAHDLAEDLLIEGPRGDCTNERDREGEAVLGLSHLVLTLLHRSIDVKYHFVSIVVVVDSVSMVVISEGVRCINGEGGCGGGGGGSGGGRRLCSGNGDILLGGLPLCWNRFTVVGMVA